MEETALTKVFKRLSQGSKQSVQSGRTLDTFDSYLHVDRPIDLAVMKAMDEIDACGGGIVFIVGSAGDGKSHMISTLKPKYKDFDYWNDASESPWAQLCSTEALKIVLSEFEDRNLDTTTSKMLVAINIGKLNAFIDDDEVKERYKVIVEYARTLLDEDYLHHRNGGRVKFVSFTNHQIFEIYPDQKDSEYPVGSKFIKNIFEKITKQDDDNVFYRSYKESAPIGNDYDPTYINYQLLCLPQVQNTIVNIIIEAIVCFKLMLTPRELFDFIYRIVVFEKAGTFDRSKDFFDSQLPSKLFNGGENKILKCISLLDPIKHGSIDHNNKLSFLFTSTSIPDNACFRMLEEKIEPAFFKLLDEFYKNSNRRYISDISKLVFRLEHLMHYNSVSMKYPQFLNLLCAYYDNDLERLFPLYELIKNTIPCYYGSYTDKSNLVPLSVQGSEFKMFVSCDNLDPIPDESVLFNSGNRNNFVVEINTRWKIKNNIHLKVEYQLFSFLKDIERGRLTQVDDRNHNLEFTKFINDIVRQSSFQDKLIIMTHDNRQMILSKVFGSKITMK